MSELSIRMRLINPLGLTVLLGCVLAISACASSAASPDKLPYRAWDLRFAHPVYMEIWVEDAQVIDIEGRLNRNAGGGTVSFGDKGNVDASGWLNKHGYPPAGKGRALTGLHLPQKISVRWQSLVEPQTFKAFFEFPAWARDKMIEPILVDCPIGGEKTDYRKDVVLGLAPGGTVKVWIRSPCSAEATEVITVQADIVEEGPYLGKSDQYVSATPEAKAYVKKHGIPYESWK